MEWSGGSSYSSPDMVKGLDLGLKGFLVSRAMGKNLKPNTLVGLSIYSSLWKPTNQKNPHHPTAKTQHHLLQHQLHRPHHLQTISWARFIKHLPHHNPTSPPTPMSIATPASSSPLSSPRRREAKGSSTASRWTTKPANLLNSSTWPRP